MPASKNPGELSLESSAAGELLSASVDHETALKAALQRMVPGFADWCVLDYYGPDDAAGALRTVHSGFPDQRRGELILELRRRYRAERGENGDVLAALRKGETLLYPDMSRLAAVRLGDDERALLDEIKLRSSIVVPIHVDGRPLGIVSFLSTQRAYGEPDVLIAQDFAAGCAEALAFVRGQHEIDRSLALLSRLYERAPVGLAFVDTDLRFRRVNEHLAQMDGVSVDRHIGRTLPDVLGELGEQLAVQFRHVLDEHRAHSEELEVRTRAEPGASRYWQVSYVPVEFDGQLLGVDAVTHDVTERRRAEIRTSFLSRAGAMLDSSLDYRDTLRSVARLVVPQIADWCSISMLNDRGEMYRLAVVHRDPVKERLGQELIERESLPFTAPAGAARVAVTAEKQVVENFTDELLEESVNDPRSLEILRTLGVGSTISVPLRARGRVLGAISLIGERPARFDPHDVRLAEDLANRAAVSIDNARLYTAHSRIARTLQAGLLPHPLPAIPGLELASRYRPAGELIEVGGDFYDAYLRPNGEWLIVIGDVTGKGAEAAASTALIRYTLRAAAQHPGGPANLLQELNAAMLAQASDYCTIGLIGVQPSPTPVGQLTICLAGHPQPMLRHIDGTSTPVGSPGTLLGYTPTARFNETLVTLEDDEVLVLYTDGLTEASAPPGWTQEHLGTRLGAAPAGTLDGLLAQLEADAITDAHGRPRDDIAMLAIRRNDEAVGEQR